MLLAFGLTPFLTLGKMCILLALILYLAVGIDSVDYKLRQESVVSPLIQAL